MEFPELQKKLNKETRELSEDFKTTLSKKQLPIFIAYCNKRTMREEEMINTYYKYFIKHIKELKKEYCLQKFCFIDNLKL